MIVLGIDPGLATTGWGVVERRTDRAALKAYGILQTPAQEILPHRLRTIRQGILELIQTHRPAILVIEQLFFTKFASSIAATAQARGVILEAAAHGNVPVQEYNPRSIKIATSGFGSASKIQMQSMVQKLLQLKQLPQPDDAADALAVALCHLHTNPLLKEPAPVSRSIAEVNR